MLDDAVLEAVVADHADPATLVGPSDGRLQALLEHVKLVVDLDAQGLEGLARGMSAVAPVGRGDRGLDDVDKLEGRLDGLFVSPTTDLAGDAARVLLIPEGANDPGEVGFVVGVDDLCCG